jgi:hypothetical protein
MPKFSELVVQGAWRGRPARRKVSLRIIHIANNNAAFSAHGQRQAVGRNSQRIKRSQAPMAGTPLA